MREKTRKPSPGNEGPSNGNITEQDEHDMDTFEAADALPLPSDKKVMSCLS